MSLAVSSGGKHTKCHSVEERIPRPWRYSFGLLVGNVTEKEVKKRVGIGAEAKNYWKLVGEVYVDGIMYYEGDIHEDIRDGKVEVRDFHLL